MTPAGGGERPARLLTAIPLQAISFPRSERLWVFMDGAGLRWEALAGRRNAIAEGMGLLRPVDLKLAEGRGRYPRLAGLESPVGLSEDGPVGYAFRQWLGELVALGLQLDDPHPELWRPLVEHGSVCEPVPRERWGIAATDVLRAYGVWVPPARCPGCGCEPGGDPARDLGCSACFPLAKKDAIMTLVGAWVIPLARLLDRIEGIYEEAFHRRPRGAKMVRELGMRGML